MKDGRIAHIFAWAEGNVTAHDAEGRLIPEYAGRLSAMVGPILAVAPEDATINMAAPDRSDWVEIPATVLRELARVEGARYD
jgi:hypothetical protein